jgi:hypothetical protein
LLRHTRVFAAAVQAAKAAAPPDVHTFVAGEMQLRQLFFVTFWKTVVGHEWRRITAGEKSNNEYRISVVKTAKAVKIPVSVF